jgi:hypothetical protein
LNELKPSTHALPAATFRFAWNITVKLRNAAVILTNVACLFARRTGHWFTKSRRTARLFGKLSRRAAEQFFARVSSSALRERTRRAATRLSNRASRFDEHVLSVFREERDVLDRLGSVAAGRGSIVAGPWVSEVGYEVLYWVPFLRWFQDRYGVHPDRLVAVSRGGVEWWYQGIASRYVDVLHVCTAEQFAMRAEARRTGRDQKQLDPSPWEREIVADVLRRCGVPNARVLYPGLMYRLFRSFWHGDRSLDFLLRHTVYNRLVRPAPSKDECLPSVFAAVKFYTGPALPDTPATREQLRTFIARLADRMPIVTLDTGLGLDEHRDYMFRDIPGVLDLREHMTPATNLAVQSRIIARASLFVGTCGSLAWLAPMLDVPTVAVYADDRYLNAHLYAARYIYRRMKSARFSVVDMRALARLSVAA